MKLQPTCGLSLLLGLGPNVRLCDGQADLAKVTVSAEGEGKSNGTHVDRKNRV